MLTQERLKEVLKYDQDTGVFTCLIDRGGLKLGDAAGYENNSGYIHIAVDSKSYLAHRLAWLCVYGYFPENNLDHINRKKTDNRISNLREVSHQCNQRNTPKRSDNTSGVKGVSWHNPRKKWQARIMIGGEKIYLGVHESFMEAVCHRLAAEQAEGWEGCDSSSPAYHYVKQYGG